MEQFAEERQMTARKSTNHSSRLEVDCCVEEERSLNRRKKIGTPIIRRHQTMYLVMSSRYRLTSVDTVLEAGGWLFTARNTHGEDIEGILVPCEDETTDTVVTAWINRCTHENQRLYREGVGVIMRDQGIICPKHGSVFDSCSGFCENGPADLTTLQSIDITIEDGQVYLTDDDVTYIHEGPDADDDEEEGPSSTSHLRF